MKAAPRGRGGNGHSGGAVGALYHLYTISMHPYYRRLPHATREFVRIERRKCACGYYDDKPHLEATLRTLLPLIIAQLAHGPGVQA